MSKYIVEGYKPSDYHFTEEDILRLQEIGQNGYMLHKIIITLDNGMNITSLYDDTEDAIMNYRILTKYSSYMDSVIKTYCDSSIYRSDRIVIRNSCTAKTITWNIICINTTAVKNSTTETLFKHHEYPTISTHIYKL